MVFQTKGNINQFCFINTYRWKVVLPNKNYTNTQFKTTYTQFKNTYTQFKTTDTQFKTTDTQFKTTDTQFKTTYTQFKTTYTQYILLLRVNTQSTTILSVSLSLIHMFTVPIKGS